MQNRESTEYHLKKAKELLSPYLPMSDEEWAVFSEGLSIRVFKKGMTVLNTGEVEPYLSIVLDGLTRHYLLLPNGEEKCFDFSFQHEFNCSYASYIQQKPSVFHIQALEDTVLASLHKNFLDQLYEQYPISNKFGRIAVEQYYLWREKRELSLLVDDAKTRYLNLMRKYPEYLQQVPLKYLASYLNLKPESLSRIRNDLRK
ncbi:MAG: Crp/Fnr family transcriptional regulator [Cyclobacterium sp.]|uniref:Crp/Fnr family transcriptional regulator n=1 Tax=unclassified Cyclobacterium TaxID=2615055 RepID=UPI0013D00242|nr:Crp/Fnr family transcriptional regulator [Cyclobacterium sp. SYSU L10401]